MTLVKMAESFRRALLFLVMGHEILERRCRSVVVIVTSHTLGILILKILGLKVANGCCRSASYRPYSPTRKVLIAIILWRKAGWLWIT